jgi:protein MAK11
LNSFCIHRGAVLYFDVHPSKKLALSVGADKKLIAWDLVAGKYSFIRNMKKVCDAVVFNKTGSRYAIRSGSIVEIYDLTVRPLGPSIDCLIDLVELGIFISWQ